MYILSQRDPRWSDSLLGSSYLTMGEYGCTTTAISMLSDHVKAWMRPDIIGSHKSWYTDKNHPQGAGLILWDRLNIPGLKFERRLFGYNYGAIKGSLKMPNKAVLLQVRGTHWVLGLGYDLLGNIRIADPWYGDKSTIKRYGGIDGITGSAHFKLYLQ